MTIKLYIYQSCDCNKIIVNNEAHYAFCEYVPHAKTRDLLKAIAENMIKSNNFTEVKADLPKTRIAYKHADKMAVAEYIEQACNNKGYKYRFISNGLMADTYIVEL